MLANRIELDQPYCLEAILHFVYIMVKWTYLIIVAHNYYLYNNTTTSKSDLFRLLYGLYVGSEVIYKVTNIKNLTK